MPTYHEGDKKVHIESWGSVVEKQIREAQARGDFDNLPGSGRPLDLEPDNPFAGEWSSAFRVAKNAGAAPLWVELDGEIGAEGEALRAMLERTARYLESEAARIRSAGVDRPATETAEAVPVVPVVQAAGATPAVRASSPTERGTAAQAGPGRRQWWPFRRAAATPAQAAMVDVTPPGPQTLAELEHERRRARALYLAKAAELDKKIQDFNAHRPRALSWIEKPRLLAEMAAQRFDARCPPLV
jgi:hypothetical protein